LYVNEEKLSKDQKRILIHQDVIELKSLQKKFTFMDWRNGVDLYRYSCEVQSRFFIEKELGSKGISGAVRLAHDIRTLKKLAVKTLDLWVIDSNSIRIEDISLAQNEIEIMRQLNHPNIVKLVTTVWDPERVHLFTELMDVGDLFHLVISPPLCRMIERETKFAMFQISQGLKYLHDKKIGHGDMKLENIFVKNCSGNYIYKIGDFGCSVVDDYATKKEGTIHYAAPEVFKDQDSVISVRKSDMWSMGIIMYACIAGSYPFDAENNQDETIR
jgi:serine/threonine protein kinase